MTNNTSAPKIQIAPPPRTDEDTSIVTAPLQTKKAAGPKPNPLIADLSGPPDKQRSGALLRGVRKGFAAATGTHGLFSGKAKGQKRGSYVDCDTLAARVDGLGEAFEHIAGKIRERRVDSYFLNSLSRFQLEETLADLGSPDKVTSRRLASELGLKLLD